MTTSAQSVRWGAATASTFYGIVLYILGLRPEQELKYAFAYVPALLGYLVLVFDKWAWRWPGIHRLDGTWRTTLSPSPESQIPRRWQPRSHHGLPHHRAVLLDPAPHAAHRRERVAVQQRLHREDKRLGRQRAPLPLREHPAGHPPAAQPRHTGACRLDLAGRTPTQMNGRYYTDRFTTGDMQLTLMNRTTDYSTYAEAAAADTAPLTGTAADPSPSAAPSTRRSASACPTTGRPTWIRCGISYGSDPALLPAADFSAFIRCAQTALEQSGELLDA